MKYWLCGRMSFDNNLFLESVICLNISGRDGRAEEGVDDPATDQYNAHGQSENIAGTGTWVACSGHKAGINKVMKSR
jgi:hypothetical protein